MTTDTLQHENLDLSIEGQVQPSEQIYVLSSSQLQDIIGEATKSLNLKVDVLEARITHLEKDKAKFEALEKDQATLSENQLIQLRLIADLRKGHAPQPLQKDRGEILRALLAANDGKMLAKEARQKMRLDEATFSRLLTTSDELIEKKAYHLDKRQSILIIK